LVVRQYADASTGALLEYSEEKPRGSDAAIRALRIRYGSQPPTV
jgi:hypothetical protein